jgi:hypothetical protein
MTHGFYSSQDPAASFFLRSAHRFFMASPIFLRATADNFRFRLSGVPDSVRAALF